MAFVLATAVAARRRGYDILLLTDEQTSEGMNRVTASNLVDAILVLDVAPDDERARIARSIRTPTVFIGIPDDADGLTCVDLDFESAGALAIDRLADAGHRRVTFFGQTEVAYRRSNFPRRLLHGVQERGIDRGVSVDWITTGAVSTDVAAVREAAAAALERGERAFLVHAVDDVHEAVLAAVSAHGLRVGTEVSLVSAAASFDTSTLSAPIDTIPLIPAQSCERAVDLAMQLLEEPHTPPAIHLLPPDYRPAGSVVPPRD
jgi:DNA-binding LacI/PurR family transcriptional regulator